MQSLSHICWQVSVYFQCPSAALQTVSCLMSRKVQRLSVWHSMWDMYSRNRWLHIIVHLEATAITNDANMQLEIEGGNYSIQWTSQSAYYMLCVLAISVDETKDVCWNSVGFESTSKASPFCQITKWSWLWLLDTATIRRQPSRPYLP